ncbi:MAG: aquaporin [Gallionella sp.]
MTPLHALRKNWPEYLMEAWGLGMFMIAAGIAVILMETPLLPLHEIIFDENLRRAIIGIFMGLTAIGIIYSPWGKQSGAHINPAVTLTFLRLGKIAPWDAFFYILAQFIGSLLGVLLVWGIFGNYFALPPVTYIETVPSPDGPGLAFVAEFLMSLGLMLTLLFLINKPRLEPWAGVAAGVLVALFITFEAPISGMSMNPARSFASALPAAEWAHLWIYFSAPILGMLFAVEIYRLLKFSTIYMCAKLNHCEDKRCIHCGYKPEDGRIK